MTLALCLVSLLLLMPMTASAGVQDIIQLLTTITSTLQNGVGQVLSGIQSINTTVRDFEQQVVWPVTLINQTRAEVSQVRAQFSSLASQIQSIPTNSAALVNPSQLEQLLRSQRAGNLGQISASYTQVYQALPQPNQATAAQRNLMDMDDALALGALKTATASDQASQQMLTVADGLEQQAAVSAPGSASILTAQAQAANLQNQAMLQKSVAAELREEDARLLGQLQQIQQQAATFQQQVIYRVSAINNARGLAGQMQGQLRQMTQLYRLPTASATLQTPQQLEQALLSHNPQALGQISQNYAKVYGTVMAPADAPQPIRNLVDMTDAEAQAAMKKALELDALADLERAAADQINQQIQNAAPGSAPILEAQASAWLVRANAYTQSAMAELIRVRSIDLANSGAQLKFNASDTNQLRNNTNQVLQRGSQ